MGEYGIIFSQIVGWNPPLGPACGNIASYVGFAICVSVPGGAWVNPSPSAVTTTTTAGFSTWSSLTAATLLPTAFDYTANASAYNLTSPALPAPYANGTRLDCTLYATAPVLTNSSSNATTLACQDVADLYGIALADLVGWNPSLNASDPCTMAEDTQYCVQLVQNTADNITSACVGWDTAPAGYDCIDFVSLFGLDLAEFIAWNLGVGDDCTNFTTGTSYCTSVAHFRQAGIVSTCNLYVMPNDTNCKFNLRSIPRDVHLPSRFGQLTFASPQLQGSTTHARSLKPRTASVTPASSPGIPPWEMTVSSMGRQPPPPVFHSLTVDIVCG